MRHPNLVWEIRRSDGRLVLCLLARTPHAHAVVRYVDGVVADVEEFDDVEAACARVRALYADVGRRRSEGGRVDPAVAGTASRRAGFGGANRAQDR